MPHLLVGRDMIIGITFLHHMGFYMENGVPQVQHKYFNTDAWGLEGLYLSSQERPNMTKFEGDLITLNIMLL